MVQLCELLPPSPEPSWALLRQAGITEVVGVMRGAEQDQRMFASVSGGTVGDRPADASPWSEAALRRDQETFADNGFTLVALEDTPPLDLARLGLPGRDEQIAHLITQVRAMGRLGIPTLCYNWMAVSSWCRTRIDAVGRGGALVTAFSSADAAALPTQAEPGEITPAQLWDAFAYFIAAVVPEAEAAGVRLALHPDDPPRATTRGVPRIMSSVDAFRRVVDLHDSRANSITLCQGNFTMMTDDLPATIREFGIRDRIAFVHFRDVIGTADDFRETFHDEGQTDMAACLRAYAEVGFDGPLRPDHVPTMAGESNARPGYAWLGRLFALGYIRGLEQAIDPGPTSHH